MRVGSWAKRLAPLVEGRSVVTEAELLDVLVDGGRTIGQDWAKVVEHNMRSIGWRLRARSRTYVRRAPAQGVAS